MTDERLALASVRELGAMLRSGETTPRALTAHYLERLDLVGRRLNAVVTLTVERAQREAAQAEAELRAGYDRGPLHGIPYGVKDLLNTTGIPTTWGAAPLRDQVFAEDATAVKRLRDAGAILVAKLSMVELAGGMGYEQPDASITGPGINPWNTDAWAGGSSSGSGSAVGGRLVPFALGSETWGSIVTPASYCGVSGLRPTYGRVSRRGAMALSWSLDKIGPLGRTADDCGLVLAAIAGIDPADPSTMATPYAYRTDGRATGFRIGVLREGIEQMQPEVRANFEASLGALSEFAKFDEVTLPDFPYAEVANVILRAEAAAAMEELAERNVLAQLTAPEDRTSAYLGAGIPAVDYLRAQRIRRHANIALDATFARYDAIVAPSTAFVASPLSMRFDDYAGKLRRLVLGAAGNIAGLPSISVPNGFGERGLPTGIQFVGRATSENTILAVARAFQERSSWHRHRPDLASAS